ncbi:MAG TPA: ABA4-like family protein [Chitinophagaceae bacterium]|nr:ABA4-like family protein [Chitinophagaceae bacterium]
MTPDTIFQVCNTIAMIGWLLLIIASPFSQGIDRFLIGIVIALFCIVYAWLIFSIFSLADFKSFGSLDGVMGLFQDKTLVTAGWVHYLAFDLFTGIWIKKNSLKYGISHWIIIPCLILTFMLGPLGLLLYLLVRTVKTKQWFAENY